MMMVMVVVVMMMMMMMVMVMMMMMMMTRFLVMMMAHLFGVGTVGREELDVVAKKRVFSKIILSNAKQYVISGSFQIMASDCFALLPGILDEGCSDALDA